MLAPVLCFIILRNSVTSVGMDLDCLDCNQSKNHECIIKWLTFAERHRGGAEYSTQRHHPRIAAAPLLLVH